MLLPGQTATYPVPHCNGSMLAVEPWFQNKAPDWPPPQLCQVKNGLIHVTNTLNKPVNVAKDAPRVQVRTTSLNDNRHVPNYKITKNPPVQEPLINDIQMNPMEESYNERLNKDF